MGDNSQHMGIINIIVAEKWSSVRSRMSAVHIIYLQTERWLC